jgi:hypothetical protein
MPPSVHRTALMDVASTEKFSAYMPWTDRASAGTGAGRATAGASGSIATTTREFEPRVRYERTFGAGRAGPYIPSTRCGRTSVATSDGSWRSSVVDGFAFAKACARMDGPVSTIHAVVSRGSAEIRRSAAVATAADAIESMRPSRGEIAR